MLSACAGRAGPPSPPPPAAYSAMHEAIEAGAYRRIEAVVVRQGDEIRYEGYFRRSGPESRIDARSAGKSITALAVGLAVDDGLMGVDDLAFEHLKDLGPFAHATPAKAQIRVGDLLSMSSSLACDDWRPSPGNEERMYRTKHWARFAVDLPTDEAYIRSDEGQGRFSYCTAGAFLLGRILERVTGESFDAYVQRELFDPLGIEGPVWRRSPVGEVQSGGQLALRARDFLALGTLVRDGGVVGDRTLLSEEWLRAMLKPRVSASRVHGYGYLWWVRAVRIGGDGPQYAAFYMSGNGGNQVVVLPALDAVVVMLATNYNRRDMHALTTGLLEQHILGRLAE